MRTLFFVLLLIPSLAFGQSVILVDVKQMNNDQHVLFIVEHKGETYEWSADIPLGVVPITHIEVNVGRYMSNIYRKMYIQAPNSLYSVAQWEVWITAGALDDEGKLVPKKPFKGKHPKSIKLKADLESATSIQGRLTILENYLLGE